MLVDRALADRVRTDRPPQAAEQLDLVLHTLDHLDQPVVAGSPDEMGVERLPQAEPIVVIMGAPVGICLLQEEALLEGFELARLDMVTGQARGKRLQHDAQLINLDQILDGEGRHEGTFTLDDPDQALALQAEYRLPDRRPAHTQPLCDRPFHQRLAAPDLAPKDELLEAVIGAGRLSAKRIDLGHAYYIPLVYRTIK